MEPQQTPSHQLPPEQSPIPKLHNPLAVMQPGERIICEIKRHPIGLLGAYFIAGLVLIALAVLAFVVLPGISLSSDSQNATRAVAGVVFLLVAALIILFVLIANIVYWGNRWVVTSDSITQMHQTGPFSKQSAQLSFENLEAVTAEQNGILAHIFNFGTLKAETAGERSNFILAFCPNPNYYAQKILAAREVFERDYSDNSKQSHQLHTDNAQQPLPSAEHSYAQPTPYQAGQTPPTYGAAPPVPPSEPRPQAPSADRSSEVPETYPDADQSAGGIHTNTRVD